MQKRTKRGEGARERERERWRATTGIIEQPLFSQGLRLARRLQYGRVLCAAGRHCANNCSRSAVPGYIVTELDAGTLIVVLSLSP